MGPGTHPRRAPMRVLLTPLDGGVGFAVPCAVRDPPAPSGTARSRQAKWPALSAVLHNAGESWLPRSDGARQGTPSAGSARVAVCTACAPWGVDETGPDAQFRATESASARRPRWLSLCRGDQPPTRRRHHRPPPVPKRVLGFCRTGCGLLLVTMTLSTVVSMPWTLSSASAPRRTSRPPPLHCWTTAFASWTSRLLANAFSPRKLHRGCKTIPLVSQSELLSPSRCGRGAPGDFPLVRRPVLPHNEASVLGIVGRRTWPPFWSRKQVRVPQAVSVTDC